MENETKQPVKAKAVAKALPLVKDTAPATKEIPLLEESMDKVAEVVNATPATVQEPTIEEQEWTPGRELRFYLTHVKSSIEVSDEDVKAGHDKFVPTYLITAVMLPTGAIELATNVSNIAEKIDYILSAYDDEMHLKTNKAIIMMNMMVV